MSWAEQRGRDVVVRVRVQPRARKTEVSGRHGDAVKIRLQAPPVDGKANRALLQFLAERLGIPSSAVQLASGVTSRDKIVKIAGLTVDTVRGAFPEVDAV